MQRYKNECEQLFQLALKQLNSPKNRVKENFEEMFLNEIIDKLSEEIGELKHELKLKPAQMDLQRIKNEIGDCGAVLTGLLAYVEFSLEKQEKFGHKFCSKCGTLTYHMFYKAENGLRSSMCQICDHVNEGA